MLVYIYALVDPRTNKVRYIGKSAYPSGRLEQHLREARTFNATITHKVCWLRTLIADGLEPRLVILETTTEEQWPERECHHIALARRRGDPLTNLTDGGEGVSGEYMSAVQRRKWADPERRAALGERSRIMLADPEMKQRMRVKVYDNPACREAVSKATTAALQAKWADPEYAARERERLATMRQLAAEGTRRYKNTPEGRALQTRVAKSQWTDEKKAVRSKEQLARWADPEKKAATIERMRAVWTPEKREAHREAVRRSWETRRAKARKDEQL